MASPPSHSLSYFFLNNAYGLPKPILGIGGDVIN